EEPEKEAALPTVSENTLVPGPTSSPTVALPNRPMLLAGRAKHDASNQRVAVGDSMFPSQVSRSGRCVEVKPRVSVPVPDGSVPLLNAGVRNDPDCTSRMPARSQPPTMASIAGGASLPTLRPRPIGSSQNTVEIQRCRRVNGALP